MIKINLANENVKRRYFEHLRGGEGLAASTVEKAERAITLWDDFTNAADYKGFTSAAAIAFKKGLSERKNQVNGRPITLTTCHHYLICLHDFFVWLAGQQGYKSKIKLDDTAYFKLDKKQTKIALNRTRKRYPTLEIVQALVSSIDVKTEVDRRDRALICFTLLSGMRDEAIATLPLGCLDIEKRQVRQDPELGVKTKFSKDILTTLFVTFEPSFWEIIKEWAEYLVKEKLFTDQDPLFPITKSEQGGADSSSFIAEHVDQRFWKGTGGIRAIFKRRFEAVGLEYFSPHAFRHLAIKLAMGFCKTPADFKAVSQNLGHENMATTMFDYAPLPDEEVEKKVKSIGHVDDGAEKVEKLQKFLKEHNITLE